MSGDTDSKTPFQLLEEKMIPEIENGHPYEALQLAESFIARKKKTVGLDTTASLVFHGVKVLVKGNSSADAGTLLTWFIEDGAGDDHYFRLGNETKDKSQHDLNLLIELFDTLTPFQSHPIVAKVYLPFHKLIHKNSSSTTSTSTTELLRKIELKWIDIFIDQKDFSIASKALVRIGEDIPRLAKVLDAWAKEGKAYASEYPLFFARTILNLLADGRVPKAGLLVKASIDYIAPYETAALACIAENTAAVEAGIVKDKNDQKATGSEGVLAIWHFAAILTELAAMEPKPRVDKTKIFNLLLERYNPIIQKIDPKLASAVYDKIAQNVFEIQVPGGSNDPRNMNPMAAMIQNMLAGGGGAAGASGASGTAAGGGAGAQAPPDMNQMIKMLAQMNNTSS